MSTHNIYFPGEMRKLSIFSVKKRPYLELPLRRPLLDIYTGINIAES